MAYTLDALPAATADDGPRAMESASVPAHYCHVHKHITIVRDSGLQNIRLLVIDAQRLRS